MCKTRICNLSHVFLSQLRPLLHSIDEVKASIVEDSIRETATSRDKTLLLYTYSNSNPEYERNLHYFVLHGVSDEDWCDYFILVQEV